MTIKKFKACRRTSQITTIWSFSCYKFYSVFAMFPKWMALTKQGLWIWLPSNLCLSFRLIRIYSGRHYVCDLHTIMWDYKMWNVYIWGILWTLWKPCKSKIKSVKQYPLNDMLGFVVLCFWKWPRVFLTESQWMCLID